MAKCIMVQGTMSGAGKSLMAAALCRIFKDDGFKVAPFKSQNMSLNSFVTPDGGEIGRAQVLQAEASGKEPDVRMNPILLKPSSDVGSQLIVLGEVRGNYPAAEYFRMKKSLIPEILAAYNGLAAENDIIVIEGAGSPAEINLRENDIVNMGLAEMVNAPVILLGNIDPGGVFAQLYGTLGLLKENERKRVIGTVINKFRGDPSLLTSGVKMLEDLTGTPVLGVVPYIRTDLDDEDSLTERFTNINHGKAVDIAVIRLPYISNFTDFEALRSCGAAGVRYISNIAGLGKPDLIIIPGTKSTMHDLEWLRETGLESAILKMHEDGVPVIGICGGYQMLGEVLRDPDGVESGGEMKGMGLLPCVTEFTPEKARTRKKGIVHAGPFAGAEVEGYEIHMGRTEVKEAGPFSILSDGTPEGAYRNNVFGTYLHGVFDTGKLTERLMEYICAKKGISLIDTGWLSAETRQTAREKDIAYLAETVRKSLDMDALYRAIDEFSENRL